jgi:hypothetical protein
MTRPRTTAERQALPALGSISDHELYPSRVFSGCVGWGRKAWTAALAAGFPTIRVGKQAFVDGRAAIEWFRRQAGRKGNDQ